MILSFCFHRRPLCRRLIGFTHDDKVERSDPAIVKASSFLIIACGRKSQEKFSFAITQRVTSGALGRPRVIGVNWRRAERREITPCMSLFPFSLIKVWIRSRAFSFFVFFFFFFWSFYESGCLKNIWSVCYRLCKIVSAGMQWKERNPTNTSRPPLLPLQKRGLLKTEKLLQLQCSFRLYVAYIWLKDHVFISTLLAMSCIPTGHMLHHRGSFWGSNFDSFMSPYVLRVFFFLLLYCKRQKTHLKYFLFSFENVHSRPFILYTPPVSGNILAPLHGFNGRDREYALKVNTTSVRNWTC